MGAEESKEKVKALLERLETGVTDILTSEDFAAWLTVMRRFHTYSWSNAWLIFAQKPDATRVAGFRTWQRMNRYVRKGEKGIQILVPWTVKGTTEDPDTGDESEYRKTIFRPGYVFDISQTDGEPLPESPAPRESLGEGPEAIEQLITVVERVILDESCTLAYEDLRPGHGGYYAPAQRHIAINRNNPRLDQFSTLIHELSHHLQYTRAKKKDAGECDILKGNYAFNETVAEGVAFVLGGLLELDFGSHAFPYIAVWASRDDGPATIRAALRQIDIISSSILKHLDGDVPDVEVAA